MQKSFYARWLMITKNWLKPTSRQISLISVLMIIAGGIAWISTWKLKTGDVSIEVSCIVFFAGLGILLLMCLFVAPYKAHKEIVTELSESHGKEIKALTEINDKAKPLIELKQRQQQSNQKSKYLWVTLHPIEWRDSGTKAYITVWLVSCLIDELAYRKISGVIKYKNEKVAIFEMEKTNDRIPKLASWHESAEVVLTKPISSPPEKYTVTADLKIECDTGEIRIEQIYEAQPKNGN